VKIRPGQVYTFRRVPGDKAVITNGQRVRVVTADAYSNLAEVETLDSRPIGLCSTKSLHPLER
jgi:hypothetical protein